MKILRHISLGLLGLFLVQMGYAQKVDAVIDRDEILIGEQAVISLSVRMNKENPPKVEFPAIGDTLLAKLEVVVQSSIDTLETGEGVKESRLEQKLYITSFDTGYYAIPPFEFKINGGIERTEPFLLSVKTVEVDTTGGIMPERGIYEVQVGFMDYVKVYWPYAAGVFGAIAAAAIIFLLVRRYRAKQKEKPAPVPPEPKIPAHLVALAELERISKEKRYLKGEIKQHHTAVTDVLRTYIEDTYRVQAHELTSRQILQELKYSGIEPAEMQSLRSVLFKADMVKFAKEIPDDRENEKSIQEAIAFVEQTTKTEEAETQSAAEE